MKQGLKFFLLILLISCQQRPKQNTVFYNNLGGETNNLNPITSTDGYSQEIQSYVMETLLTRDTTTYEWRPSLAADYKISKDQMNFIFTLRDGVKWHDGMPLTVEDVKFSFDVIFDDNYQTAHLRPYYEGIKEVKIIDDKTVEFVAKDRYYGNFDTAATMLIMPKHFYTAGFKKSVYSKTLIGTGPYKLAAYDRGVRILLEKNQDWWGFKIPGNKEHNFEKIVLRFASDFNVQMEMLKKGSLDFITMRAANYVQQTTGKEWGKSVHKVAISNKMATAYNFIGWNLKHPILKSKKIRKALYHLVNRKLMIDKFEFGYSVLAKGPVYPASPYANPNIPVYQFNPKLALQMLREEGWSDTDGDRILDKVIDGKKHKFSITILEPYEGFVKYLTVFKEDAKKIGVEINIKVMEWNSFTKLLYEKKFDAIRMAWGGVVDWDPKQIWHSSSMNGGSNYVGYSNPEVDKAIDHARTIYDQSERIKVLMKIQEIIADDAPYVWFTFKKEIHYGVTDRIKREVDTLPYSLGRSYWSFKSAMRKDIE